MVFEVISKFAFYATHVLKGLFEIAIGKEEFIYGAQGKIISRLPSKRKQVLIFAKNFLKEPASRRVFFSIYWILVWNENSKRAPYICKN